MSEIEWSDLEALEERLMGCVNRLKMQISDLDARYNRHKHVDLYYVHGQPPKSVVHDEPELLKPESTGTQCQCHYKEHRCPEIATHSIDKLDPNAPPYMYCRKCATMRKQYATSLANGLSEKLREDAIDSEKCYPHAVAAGVALHEAAATIANNLTQPSVIPLSDRPQRIRRALAYTRALHAALERDQDIQAAEVLAQQIVSLLHGPPVEEPTFLGPGGPRPSFK